MNNIIKLTENLMTVESIGAGAIISMIVRILLIIVGVILERENGPYFYTLLAFLLLLSMD